MYLCYYRKVVMACHYNQLVIYVQSMHFFIYHIYIVIVVMSKKSIFDFFVEKK